MGRLGACARGTRPRTEMSQIRVRGVSEAHELRLAGPRHARARRGARARAGLLPRRRRRLGRRAAGRAARPVRARARCRSTSPSSRWSWTPGWRASCVARPGVGLHQHGLAHVNHEREGRRCEFGPARGAAAQRRDIAARPRAPRRPARRPRRPDLHPALEPLHRRHRPLPRRARLRGALARGARGAARRAGPARAAGQRRLVRPPPRRAAEPGRSSARGSPPRSAPARRSG